jgi:4-amino-4-deoxy-L-arabinose transferase-like glycosyltransferase
MIKKNNINNLFILFLLSHLIIWTLIPTYSNTNLPLDTIEALAWGSNLDWGFNKHPPLSAFALEIFYQIFGNQDWAYYLLSQIFVILSFYVVWIFSNEFFQNKLHSFLSVLILEGIVFYNYTTPEFNVYVCQLPFRALAVYYCWKCYENDNIKNWIILGITAALGFLSHYLFIYLILSIKLFFILQIIKYKKFNSNYIIASSIFLLILTPHLIWLVKNDFTTITYGLHRTSSNELNFLEAHVYQPIIFLFKQIGMLLPVIITFFVLFSFKKINLKNRIKDKKLFFLIIVNILPLVLIFITSALMGVKIRTMWISPFYLFFGVLFIYLFKSKINFDKFKKISKVFLVLFFVSPLIYLYVSISQTEKRTDYPGREIALLVEDKWYKNFSNDIAVVVGNEWLGGNLSYHLKSRPTWFSNLNSNLENINIKGGFIYTGNANILKQICPGVFGSINKQGICMIGSR